MNRLLTVLCAGPLFACSSGADALSPTPPAPEPVSASEPVPEPAPAAGADAAVVMTTGAAPPVFESTDYDCDTLAAPSACALAEGNVAVLSFSGSTPYGTPSAPTVDVYYESGFTTGTVLNFHGELSGRPFALSASLYEFKSLEGKYAEPGVYPQEEMGFVWRRDDGTCIRHYLRGTATLRKHTSSLTPSAGEPIELDVELTITSEGWPLTLQLEALRSCGYGVST